jgi:phosphoribosylamine--glycine ligase
MEERKFGDAGAEIVIEEFLEGQECSIHALVDGHSYLLFPSAQDHKRALDGDTGLNTGGMGTFSPADKVLPPAFEKTSARRGARTVSSPAFTPTASTSVACSSPG